MAEYPYIDRSNTKYTRAQFNPHPQAGTSTTKSSSGTAGTYSFNDYQEDTATTAIYPGAGTGSAEAVNYTILGLIGEAGEIANKWKKFYRDGELARKSIRVGPYFNEDDWLANRKQEIVAELGDVLWYVSQLATELGTDLGDVAADNIRKLNDRNQRNVIGGSGDYR